MKLIRYKTKTGAVNFANKLTEACKDQMRGSSSVYSEPIPHPTTTDWGVPILVEGAFWDIVSPLIDHSKLENMDSEWSPQNLDL